MSNYFLYVRKSTDTEDKQVRSIDDQLAVLRSLAKEQNIEISEEFVERRSAKTPGRVIFNEMLTKLQKGQAQGIICWKLDRLARNPVDAAQVQWLLQQGTIQHIRTHDRSYYPQDNVMIMNMEFGIANQYIRDLSTNTKRGLYEKAKRGDFPGIAPIGYLNDVRSKTIMVDKRKSKAIKAAFELYSQGNSRLEDISKFLFEKGVKSFEGNPLHKDRVRFILTNIFYYGMFIYKDEVYQGNHTPLVEKCLFDKVQEVIIKRGHPQRILQEPKPFCGLLRCSECNCMITAEVQKTHTYYRCSKKNKAIKCSQAYVREEILATELSGIISSFAIPKDWADDLLHLSNDDELESLKKSEEFAHSLREQVKDLSMNLDRLTDLYVAQDIEREDYLNRRGVILSKKKSLEEKIAKLEHSSTTWLEPFQNWLKQAQTLEEIAKGLDQNPKKSAAQTIFGSNLYLRNKEIEFTPEKQWAALAAARKNFSEKNRSIILAGVPGFEPGIDGPEPSALPLGYTPSL